MFLLKSWSGPYATHLQSSKFLRKMERYLGIKGLVLVRLAEDPEALPFENMHSQADRTDVLDDSNGDMGSLTPSPRPGIATKRIFPSTGSRRVLENPRPSQLRAQAAEMFRRKKPIENPQFGSTSLSGSREAHHQIQTKFRA